MFTHFLLNDIEHEIGLWKAAMISHPSNRRMPLACIKYDIVQYCQSPIPPRTRRRRAWWLLRETRTYLASLSFTNKSSRSKSLLFPKLLQSCEMKMNEFCLCTVLNERTATTSKSTTTTCSISKLPATLRYWVCASGSSSYQNSPPLK